MNHFTPALLNEIHQKMGRNLFRFQQIEYFLKIILPNVHTGSKAQEYIFSDGIEPEGYRKYRELISRKTFGNLISEFKKFNEYPDGFFDVALEKVVQSRNELTHHFFEHPDFHFVDVYGIENAIKYLDNQFEEANEFFEFTRVQCSAFLLFEEISEAKSPLEAEQIIERRKGILHPGIEIICEEDPSKTLWETTRVVRALKLAELHSEKIDNMTLLASAGRYIKNSFPDITLREYGLRKLSEVILHSNLFDFITKTNEANSVDFLYKSKIDRSHH
jgi:hypothetical protein